jgi:hypothetical protein
MFLGPASDPGICGVSVVSSLRISGFLLFLEKEAKSTSRVLALAWPQIVVKPVTELVFLNI